MQTSSEPCSVALRAVEITDGLSGIPFLLSPFFSILGKLYAFISFLDAYLVPSFNFVPLFSLIAFILLLQAHLLSPSTSRRFQQREITVNMRPSVAKNVAVILFS